MCSIQILLQLFKITSVHTKYNSIIEKSGIDFAREGGEGGKDAELLKLLGIQNVPPKRGAKPIVLV